MMFPEVWKDQMAFPRLVEILAWSMTLGGLSASYYQQSFAQCLSPSDNQLLCTSTRVVQMSRLLEKSIES